MNTIWKILAGSSPVMALLVGLLYIWNSSLELGHTQEMERLRLLGEGIKSQDIRCYQDRTDTSLCHSLLRNVQVQKQVQIQQVEVQQ